MTNPLSEQQKAQRRDNADALALTQTRQTELASLFRLSSTGAKQKESPGLTTWQECKLRPGVWISLLDETEEKRRIIRYHKSEELIDFGFILDGCFKNQMRGFRNGSREFVNQPGFGGVGYLPEAEGYVEIPDKTRMRVMHVHVAKETLCTLLKDDMDTMPREFAKILEGGASRDFFYHGAVEPAVLASVRELTCGIRSGLPRRIFLEGKALELVAMQLFWLHNRESGPSCLSLSPDERNRIHAAKEALVENLAYPPTVSALSQRFNLSINKLQFGFQEIFGSTVYGFLKEYKLQKAQSLFKQADMNVSEVAWEVGYVNISHFSAAFKKRFGILPKQFLSSIRRIS